MHCNANVFYVCVTRKRLIKGGEDINEPISEPKKERT